VIWEAADVSQEEAQAFVRKVGTEKSFANVLDNLKSKDELLNAARSLGYNFTAEELQAAIVRIMDLDDTDLDAVTGGAGGTGVFGYGKVLSLVTLLGMKSPGQTAKFSDEG
jgi:predicted ribosomally synthesized peptide with nif11-like leader